MPIESEKSSSASTKACHDCAGSHHDRARKIREHHLRAKTQDPCEIDHGRDSLV
jgi:hypothetical protein